RGEMVDWMGEHGLNLLVIAAKNDPAQRARWREPLSADYKRELETLKERGAKRSVSIAWTLSPLGANASAPDDLSAAGSKFRSVLAPGLRQLAIAFDDTEPDPRHVDFANAVMATLAKDYPDLEMTFVPAVYWSQAAPSAYLDRVANALDPRFRVGWTGPGVL